MGTGRRRRRRRGRSTRVGLAVRVGVESGVAIGGDGEVGVATLFLDISLSGNASLIA